MTAPAPDPVPVKRRHVFYIPGHDPAGARRYREIYRREGAKQAAISGYSLAVEALPSDDGIYRWRAETETGGQCSEAVIEFLEWDDLVRRSLSRSMASAFLLTLRTFWIYLSSGALLGFWRVRPVMVFAVLYPLALYLLLPLAGLVAGAALYALATLAAPLPGWSAALFLAAGFAVAIAIFRRYDRRFFVSYLVLAYAYIAGNRGKPPEGLYARGEMFVERVAAALESDVDEVLVIGHSAGAGIAVSICAMLIRAGRVPPGKLALLGIGSVTQMISFLPRAQWMRADLNLLARSDLVTWVEVSAPSDGMCFALADPVATTGVDPAPEEKRWPLCFSAAYHLSLSDAARADPGFTQYRRHFQYIHAFDRPRDYDYFQITAGPLRLADRYRGRGSSPSCIRRAASPHRDFPHG